MKKFFKNVLKSLIKFFLFLNLKAKKMLLYFFELFIPSSVVQEEYHICNVCVCVLNVQFTWTFGESILSVYLFNAIYNFFLKILKI